MEKTNKIDQFEIARRLVNFRELCLAHVYSEPLTELHSNVIDHIVPKLVSSTELTSNQKILDVGCGQGYAMKKFIELGCTNIQGLTLSNEDYSSVIDQGMICHYMDMSFMEFESDSFDFLFVRHALEHSPYPFLTLLEFFRVIRPGGGAFIEMPSPKCSRVLESYDNHYSIMGAKQWKELMKRAGFEIPDLGEISFEVSSKNEPDWKGNEVYEWYLLKKPSDMDNNT